MFSMDTRNIDKLQREIKFLGRGLYPRIQGATLNKAAFETRQKYIMAARRKLTLRNKWTERSIRVERVRGFNPGMQRSVVGSVAEYMLDQEVGATITRTGKHGVDIPTSSASGEGLTARPRRKVVKRPNRRGSIKLQRQRIKAKSKKQFIVAAIKLAAQRGGRNKFVYLPFDRHPGIYKVMGGRRRARIVQIHDFSRPSVVISPRRPLKQSVDAIAPRLPGYFVGIARNEIRRSGIFR